MGLFDFLKKKKIVDNTPEYEVTMQKKVKINSPIEYFSIHPDIQDLLWIKNGPKKNYIPEKNADTTYQSGGITISFSMSNEEEPSLINLNLPIEELKKTDDVESPSYYPSYESLTSQQRYKYWEYLADPYNTSVNIGYVFLFYYGLERHLFNGEMEKAVKVLLKLRDVHANKSFQTYSGNAIVLSCIKHKRPDLMQQFLDSLDQDHEFQFSDSLFLLALYSFSRSLEVRDMIRIGKSFGYTKTNYIKSYPDFFERNLQDVIVRKYNRKSLVLSDLTSLSLSSLQTIELRLFANMSLIEKQLHFPNLLSDAEFVKKINDVLEETHERVKVELAEMRKKNITPVKKDAKKPEKVLIFDKAKERQLLTELDESLDNAVNRHFSYNHLQDFYYKYRDLDQWYLDECIKYCYADIETLDELNDAYVSENIKRQLSLTSFYSKEEIDSNIDKIVKEKFQGNIPAFSRLGIIYEKKKEYQKAIDISYLAVEYYRALDSLYDVEAFERRIEKLQGKKDKAEVS